MAKQYQDSMEIVRHFGDNYTPIKMLPTDASRMYSIPNPARRGNTLFNIDSRWIAPYNPYLSKKYKSHINVESCQSIRAIKYINKYVYKGSDLTALRISDTENEIDKHLQNRYIGPTEAFGRIFEYKVHEEDPTVTLLSLHLPLQQSVYFSEMQVHGRYNLFFTTVNLC